MAKTSEIAIGRARRSTSPSPSTSRPIHAHPQITHLVDAEGVRHRIYTVTCGQCLQQYRALGDHDGVYEPARQPEPHVCRDGR